MKPIFLLFLCSLGALADPVATNIKVDQVGYPTLASKLALVVSAKPAVDFTVRRSDDGTVALKGKLSEARPDTDSGDRVQTADFSKLNKDGSYFLEVPGVGRSWNFRIGRDVFSRAYYLSMRSFYGQRCGSAVDLGPDFPGFKHAACHLQGAYHPSSGKSGPAKSTAGWHDAGDYGRYIVNSGISTGTLLWTWEIFGKNVRNIGLKIPESGNGTPDILSEIRWNLDWMLTMQDPQDGGVWQKQTSDHFCGFIMPEKDTLVSDVIGTGKAPFKNSCATADFAAVMAIAGRVYVPFDPAYAKKCLLAARQAWTWLEANPNIAFRNPAGVSTGEYGDPQCGDEHLWAAAELWRTTKEAPYERYFLDHFAEYRKTLSAARPEGWGQVAPLGLWTYVLGGGANSEAVKCIRDDSAHAADEIVQRSQTSGYRVSLASSDYVWGSNGIVANYGMQLLVANILRPNPQYVAAALDNLHYLLGRNTFSLSWVTQLGENPFRHPHHRPSAASGNPEPWPGLLSGGPNRGRQDAPTKALPAGLPPAKIYVDDQASYASNEIAINWNAPLVFVLAGLLPD